MVSMSSSRTSSGKGPTVKLRSSHLALSRQVPLSTRRCISLAIATVLKWVSRATRSRQVDIYRREATDGKMNVGMGRGGACTVVQ